MRRYPGKRKAVLSGYAARREEAFGLSDVEHGQAVAACAMENEVCEEGGAGWRRRKPEAVSMGEGRSQRTAEVVDLEEKVKRRR